MEILHGIPSAPLGAEATAVTVGFFDGVHRGHQAVIGRTVDVARSRGLPAVAVTFDRHPREVFAPGTEPRLLTTLDRKAGLIAQLGVGALVVLEFNEEFSRWPAEDFVRKFLADGLHAGHTVVGSNFTFGHKAAGNLAMLAELGAACGFSVEGVALLKIDGRAVSSSSIRDALVAGDLGWPAQALGRRFVVDGTVVAGAGRGAALGYPTANLEVSSRMQIPGEGVYAGRALVGDDIHVAAVNVGTNPTFGGEPLHVEAFLLDFDDDIQGQPIAVEFWERLRDEQRFESPQALAAQIAADVEQTKALVAQP
jgi:riboflavin kinase/FMN adenylyltransferase